MSRYENTYIAKVFVFFQVIQPVSVCTRHDTNVANFGHGVHFYRMMNLPALYDTDALGASHYMLVRKKYMQLLAYELQVKMLPHVAVDAIFEKAKTIDDATDELER